GLQGDRGENEFGRKLGGFGPPFLALAAGRGNQLRFVGGSSGDVVVCRDRRRWVIGNFLVSHAAPSSSDQLPFHAASFPTSASINRPSPGRPGTLPAGCPPGRPASCASCRPPAWPTASACA